MLYEWEKASRIRTLILVQVMLLLRQIKKGLCESPNQDIQTEAMNHLLDRRIQVQSLLLSLVVTSDSKNWSLTAWLVSKPKNTQKNPSLTEKPWCQCYEQAE